MVARGCGGLGLHAPPLVCADSAADRRDGGPMSAATGAMSVQPVLRVAETRWCAPEQLAWVCMLCQPLVSAHFCSMPARRPIGVMAGQ